MFEAICQRKGRVLFTGRTIHRLQVEMPKLHLLELLGFGAGLRIDQLQLISATLLKPCAGLWADANPTESGRNGDGSVGLNGNFKTAGVQRIDEFIVELQQWLAARAND